MTNILFAAMLYSQLNQVRAENHAPPLKRSLVLERVASDRLSDMQLNGYFAHRNSKGIGLAYWLGFEKYRYSVAGENLARGFSSPEGVTRAWMVSEGHRANMIDRDFKEVGIATDGNLVVETFGLKR